MFGIDASSDPAKFQDGWPSGSPLIGAWSMTWHQLDKIVKNWHQAVKLHFFGPNSIFYVPDRFNRSISRSLVNLKKIGQGHIIALSRDQVTESRISHFQNMLRSSQCAPLLFGMRVGALQVRIRLILIYAEKFPLDKWGNLTHEYIGRKN